MEDKNKTIANKGQKVVLTQEYTIADVNLKKGDIFELVTDWEEGYEHVDVIFNLNETIDVVSIPTSYLTLPDVEEQKFNAGNVVETKRTLIDKDGVPVSKGKQLTVVSAACPDDYVVVRSENNTYHIKQADLELKGVKNDILDDKLRWDLLPMEEIEDIVKVYHAGAKKYSVNSWQNLDNGFERYRAALFRHMMEYMKGERIDTDTGCFHLAQVAWNAIAMLWYDKHGKGLHPNSKDKES